MTFNHLHLKVKNISESIHFYKEAFGFSEKMRFSDTFVFMQGDSGFALALVEEEPARVLPDGIHFGVGFKSKDRVESLYKKFQLQFPNLIKSPLTDKKTWGDFYCVDPTGNEIQIYWDAELHPNN